MEGRFMRQYRMLLDLLNCGAANYANSIATVSEFYANAHQIGKLYIEF